MTHGAAGDMPQPAATADGDDDAATVDRDDAS